MITRMEQTYYEVHIPQISKNLEKIAEEFKRSNHLKEKELELKEIELELLEKSITHHIKKL
ncbi:MULTISPECIES: hypothetical protein [Oceanobacillus]|uniref:hypothetical protein n=1 Tax=Oceanobacillus TaxID=182709 RepID=UPI000595DD25|nr:MULTISPECIES: hypothetical protein [Oceanobacillus]